MSVKRMAGLVLIGFIVVLVGCGSKYNDLVKVDTEYLNAMDEYVTGMGKASSAKDMVKVIDRFADKMEKLAPRIKKTRSRYPELKNSETVPEELKHIVKKAEALKEKMEAGYMNMMKYMMDPGVQEAQQRLQIAMMGMK
jgi:hypothetical protein